MSLFTKIILSLMLTVSLSSFSYASKQASSKKVKPISSNYFFKKISKNISSVMCRKNGYIDKCYKIKLNKCKSIIDSNKSSCLIRNKYTNKKHLTSKRRNRVTRKVASCLQRKLFFTQIP